MEVEVNAAQRPVVVGLAEDDGDVPVQRNAVAKTRRAGLVCGNGFLHQRFEATPKLVRGLVETHDKFVVVLSGDLDLTVEIFGLLRHGGWIIMPGAVWLQARAEHRASIGVAPVAQ